MSPPGAFPPRVLVLPLLAAFCSGACAAHSATPPLRIHTGTVVATVRDDGGRTLGVTPFAERIPLPGGRRLVLSAPGHDSAVVTIGWRAGVALVVDGAARASWTGGQRSLHVTLVPAPPAPASGKAAEAVSDPVAALVLAELADAARDAGCEPMMVDAWRDAASVLAGADAQPVPDSVRRIAGEEVDRARAEVREICSRRGPRVERLRQIREVLADTIARAEGAPPALAPVYFAADAWEVRDDSVRTRLRALGARLAGRPVTLVVEGYGDGAELRHRELGAQRAHAVIRELRAGGLPADCCVALSHTGDASAAGLADARQNRRVTLTLDYREPP